MQDSAIIERRHTRFKKTVCESEIVYALKNNQGFATSVSNHFEDEKGNPTTIICFWAEKSLAKSCIKNEWSDYNVCEISLPDFIENWCIGMENEGLLIGTEFDQNMFGFEADPLELIIELIMELKTARKNINLRKFDDLTDLEKQIKAILE